MQRGGGLQQVSHQVKTYLFDKLDTAQIQVILCVGVKHALCVNTARANVGMTIELGTAPNEG